MPVNLSALRTEILTDPRGLGYSTGVTRGDHNLISDLLNTRAASHSVSIGTIFSIDMQQAVVAAEYAVISGGQRDLWNAIITTAVNGVQISNTILRTQVAFVWSAATTTRANLLALDTRTGSRAEVLFGEGTFIGAAQVGKSLE